MSPDASVAAAPRTPTVCHPAPGLIPHDQLDILPRDAVVAVALSGGVDSSVAAARLVTAGMRCFAVTLAMWSRDPEGERDRGCCSVDAVEDARRVCSALGIPHYVWNLRDGFRRAVVADFEAEYAAGRTPNPCVRCNERVKLGLLMVRARAAGASHLATGHYARLGRRGGRLTLHRGLAGGKDQSYALHRARQAALGAAVFPLGGMPGKQAVRDEARRLGLPTAAKPDSQELCFVDGPLRADLERRLAGRYAAGDIVSADGRRLGRHGGLPFFTVGQRAGLGIAPRRHDEAPLHVLELDSASNRVVVGPREHLVRERVWLTDCAWVDTAPRPGLTCILQLRAHGGTVDAAVETVREGTARLRLPHGASAVAPGQSGVLYRGDEVLGGGIIAGAA